MTIAQILLTNRDVEATILLSYVLKLSKEFLFIHPEHKVSRSQVTQFDKLANRRRKNEPIAYIIGSKEFYGQEFLVNKDVLIPRPETEWLVDKAIQYAKKITKPKIIDVGTGSGIIAICVAQKLKPKFHITATDISSKALAVAKRNAKLNQAKVRFLKRDLLNNIPEKFDLIIANLPYVPLADYKKYKTNLKFEPKQALTDGSNNSKLISKFLPQAVKKLNTSGKILLEIDPSSKPVLMEQIKKMPGVKIKFYPDINDLIRYAVVS